MDLLRELQQNVPPFAVDIIRLAVWLFLLMLVFVPLERLFAESPQKIFRKGWLADLGYYFLNGIVARVILAFPMAAIAWLMHRLVPGTVHSSIAALPLPARLLAALVAGELGYYWGHRWTHEIPLLWRFHSVHHSPVEVDWLINTRAHPLDIVFSRLCMFVPMYALGLARPLAGQHLDVVPMLVMLIGTAWGFFVHSNLRWRFGWLEWLIATPHFHHWHHTNDDHVNRNYASMLPIMDKIFGTAYLPPRKWPPLYGIRGPMSPTLLGQLLHPLLPEDHIPTLVSLLAAPVGAGDWTKVPGGVNESGCEGEATTAKNIGFTAFGITIRERMSGPSVRNDLSMDYSRSRPPAANAAGWLCPKRLFGGFRRVRIGSCSQSWMRS
jgi:sterol desaturase/sphingolipid hydroxylase (fatty acid hydroxylase superfamily)